MALQGVPGPLLLFWTISFNQAASSRWTGQSTSYPTGSPTAHCRPVPTTKIQSSNFTRDLRPDHPGEPGELHIHSISPETFVPVIRANRVNLWIITTCRVDLPKHHSSCLLQLYLLFRMNIPSEGGCHQCNSWGRATHISPVISPYRALWLRAQMESQTLKLLFQNIY